MGFMKTIKQAGRLTFPVFSADRDPFMRTFAAYPARKWPSRTSHWAPLCDVFDDGTAYRLEAEIPGALLMNLRLCVKTGRLTLDAWGKGFNLATDKPCYSRTFYLDSPVDLERSVAEFEDGGKVYAVLPKLMLDTDNVKTKTKEGEIPIVPAAPGNVRSKNTSKLQSISLGSFVHISV